MPSTVGEQGVSVERPASAAHFSVSCIAMVIALAALAWMQRQDSSGTLRHAVLTCLLLVVVIIYMDVAWFCVHRRLSTGLEWEVRGRRELARVGVKLLGLLVTLAPIALVYWLCPEYSDVFYAPYWEALETYGVGCLALAPLYFYWLDGLQKEPRDAYWTVGTLLLGRRPDAWSVVRQHFAGWAVKAFFLPLMTVYLLREIGTVQGLLQRQPGAFASYDFFYHLSFLVDLLFCVVGYCMTLRVTDTHIRSTEPTTFGWIVALVCYQPFYSFVEARYLHYDSHFYWTQWLAAYPTVKIIWGSAIILLLVAYSLSTVAFGLRFSNLTHRGIITCGPYRFSKHPAYLSKNLSWWLISVPFISNAGVVEAIKNCLALAALNLIYYLRAKTEERHLRRDPGYVAYAAWIAEHGLLRNLRRLIPIEKFYQRLAPPRNLAP